MMNLQWFFKLSSIELLEAEKLKKCGSSLLQEPIENGSNLSNLKL